MSDQARIKGRNQHVDAVFSSVYAQGIWGLDFTQLESQVVTDVMPMFSRGRVVRVCSQCFQYWDKEHKQQGRSDAINMRIREVYKNILMFSRKHLL